MRNYGQRILANVLEGEKNILIGDEDELKRDTYKI